MGSRRDVTLLVVLALVIALLAAISGGSAKRNDADRRPSSYLTSPGGTKALHDALDELGVRTDRRLSAFDAPARVGPLVLVAPTEGISPGELHALAEWVRKGGTLIYAAGVFDAELRDTLGLRLVKFSGDTIRLWDAREERTATASAHEWTRGVATVEGFGRAWSVTPALRRRGARPLLTSGGRPVAAVFPMGEGRVMAWSDPTPLTNARLRRSGAAVPFARAAADAAGPKGTVWFDEYHHGYRGGGSAIGGTWRFLRDRAWGHVVVQWLVVGAGLLLLFGRRFGEALQPPPARRRSPLEHVEALAGAYRQGGARRTARRLLLAGLARRMGRRVPREGTEREMLERLTAHPGAGDAARALRDEWRKGDSADLVALSRDVDRLLEETRRT
jgi:hypothetical protein